MILYDKKIKVNNVNSDWAEAKNPFKKAYV